MVPTPRHDADPSTGRSDGPVDTSVNPMFFSSGVGSGGSPGGVPRLSVIDSVVGMAAPPTAEMWRVFQEAFQATHGELLELKQRAQRAEEQGELRAVAPDGGGSKTPAAVRRKQAFGPVACSGDPAAAALTKPSASSLDLYRNA
jgi:hypothetical protein